MVFRILAQLIFLVARRRAMASGSVPAIHKMFAILEYQEREEKRGITIDMIRRQFELEYQVTLTPSAMQSAERWISPTAQELSEERSFLQQRLASYPGQTHP